SGARIFGVASAAGNNAAQLAGAAALLAADHASVTAKTTEIDERMERLCAHRAARAFRIFRCSSGAQAPAVRGRRLAVRCAERGRKMCMAREAKIERERSQVFGVRKLDQRAAQTQASLIAGDRDAFVPAKKIGQIRRRDVELRSEGSEREALATRADEVFG